MVDDEVEAQKEEEAERGQLNEEVLTNELTALAKKLKLSEIARSEVEAEARGYKAQVEELERDLAESRGQLAAMTAANDKKQRKPGEEVKSKHERRLLSLQMMCPVFKRAAYRIHYRCIETWRHNSQACRHAAMQQQLI